MLMSDKIAISVGSTPPASLPSASSPELAKCMVYVPCHTSRRKRWRYSSATSLSVDHQNADAHSIPLMCCGLLLAGQADDEFSELALTAVDLDRAAMLLRDDVPADREPETRPFAGRFGREERLKQLVPDFGRDAGAVVAHPDLDRFSQIAGRHSEGRSVAGPAVAAGALVGGVKAVADQVQQHAGHLLRRQLDRCDS